MFSLFDNFCYCEISIWLCNQNDDKVNSMWFYYISERAYIFSEWIVSALRVTRTEY